jgi:hypothetical protein
MPDDPIIPLVNWDEIHDLTRALEAPTDAIEYMASSTRRAPYSNVSDGPTPMVRTPSGRLVEDNNSRPTLAIGVPIVSN